MKGEHTPRGIGISENAALEIADNWEQMAATEANSSPDRRATLRECADLVRMMATLKPKACPHAAPWTYCPECVVTPCPLGLSPRPSPMEDGDENR